MRTTGFIIYILLFLFPAFIQAEDYYWVGGTGNWSNLNHWRTADNQIPNEVPDAYDNVIFNENSFLNPFDTVYINTGNPTCHDMTWENLADTVVLKGGTNTVSFDIFGSVTMHPKVLNKFSGKMAFLSNEQGNTITCAGTNFSGTLFFEGSGEWILQDTLLVLDTIAWEFVFFAPGTTTYGNSSLIRHNNGRLDVNEQAIITGSFVTNGIAPCELDFENASAYILGSWTLSGDNLTFNGNNSYIQIGNAMFNLNADEILYQDVEFIGGYGTIYNSSVHTTFRKVHFSGGGSVTGNSTVGLEGTYTMDTLLFDGSSKSSSSGAPVTLSGSDFSIHYIRIDTMIAHFDVNESTFHRIDFKGLYWGSLFEGSPDLFRGFDNIIDTCVFFKKPARFVGRNTVTGLLYFGKESTISAKGEDKNTVNHAVFASNGYLEGNNDFGKLTLATGYHYRFQADSLIQPGSYHSNKFIQTIETLEVNGNCDFGPILMTSDYKPVQAIIDITGGPVNANYLQIRDIKNIGSTLTVTNGIDDGNNGGINFTDPLQPRTLYWVNGEGEWSDTYHWSLNSNGIGGECPPTSLDDIFFDAGSGFTYSEDTVLVRSPNIYCNDMTWVDGLDSWVYFVSADTTGVLVFDTISQSWYIDSIMKMIDSCALHISGSIELDPRLTYSFGGDVYFESENDDDYEIIDLESIDSTYDLLNKAIFDGNGGKWKLQEGTRFNNSEDSVIFRQGELLFTDDTIIAFNFISLDTLPRKLSLLGKTLFVVRQSGADAWNIDASPGMNGNTLFEFDAGRSTIRSIGDQDANSAKFGRCDILTKGSPLTYHNIEFGYDSLTEGDYSMLKSRSECTYNRVDIYYSTCYVLDTGYIDTLTWHPSTYNCSLRNQYEVNVIISEGENNSLADSHIVDTAFFYGSGIIGGHHRIGYLQAGKFMSIQDKNIIDTTNLLDQAEILGKNYFSQLVLSPNNRYIFQHDDETGNDTTFIEDDLVVNGYCDQPIRLESDQKGFQAKILYKANNPTTTGYTADYVSIRDIAMIPFGSNEYIATNSIDLGNNENWLFTENNNNIYYWIGGQGSWSDWQHWSYTSGGLPISEQCTPRENNTVVFDDNSFSFSTDTVLVDVPNAYCKNMWWKHNGLIFKPAFIASDSSLLFVYGSLMLNDSLDYRFAGDVIFDQYNEPGNVPDTIYSHGQVFHKDVYLQGEDDVIILNDSMTFSLARDQILYHLSGNFNLNGHKLNAGAYHSNVNTPRILNIQNSIVTLKYNTGRAWWINGDNYELQADNSTLINNSINGTILTKNGDYLKYSNIILEGPTDSIHNMGNTVEYNVVKLNSSAGRLSGDFIADSVLIEGQGSAIFDKSNIHVVIINALNGSINNSHQIDRCLVYKKGKIDGNNKIDYAVFYDDGTFLGQNTFDTLILYPGQGNQGNLGNWFFFQIDSTQTIIDSLYIRGNQCSNMNISTTPPNSPVPAFIRKDNGFDIAADYLNIYNVGAYSGGDVAFYAGANSTPLPNPDIPPPGWIFENAQGYISGFNGKTESFCTGEEYAIDASAFNGGPSTQYFWNGIPGEVSHPVNEPGTYYINVVYSEDCEVNDSIFIEEFAPPIANIPDGPFCEGYPIEVEVTPSGDDYSYVWWNGEQSAAIEAQLDYTGTVSVVVNDMNTSCLDTAFQEIVVKPTPDPESVLGPDTTIKFEETITLDAGEGDFYDWTSEPFQPIDNPDQRHIIVPGYVEPVEYIVWVELDGCGAEGTMVVSMYPPSRIGIPTAFSPNGDGLNDVLFVRGSGFTEIEFKVFNRFGQLVFETTNPDEGWNGKFEGIDQPGEVYTWLIKASFADQTLIEDAGNVTLLR
jgi:gliding motility-associated-like protein